MDNTTLSNHHLTLLIITIDTKKISNYGRRRFERLQIFDRVGKIEPEEGKFDLNEIEHYRQVIKCCRSYNIEPIVTLHHFSSPKWLISKGAGKQQLHRQILLATQNSLLRNWRRT
jgi:hypothetical protein